MARTEDVMASMRANRQTREDYQTVLAALQAGKGIPDGLVWAEFTNENNHWLCAYECICHLTDLQGLEAVYVTYVLFRKWKEKEYEKFPLLMQLHANLVGGKEGFPYDKLSMGNKRLIDKIQKRIAHETGHFFENDEATR